MKELYKRLKELEEKWGIAAWNDICQFLGTMDEKVRQAIKSRDKWRIRAETAEKQLKENSNG